MSSKRAHVLRGYRLRSGLDNHLAPCRKSDTQIPGPEPNESGTRVGGIKFHGFIPFSLSHIPSPCLWLSHFPAPRPEQHQRGVKWRERPPPVSGPVQLQPPALYSIAGAGPALPGGGRSRHNDPCGKARIPEA